MKTATKAEADDCAVLIVDNTGADTAEFFRVFADCVANDVPLPAELADLFTLEVINVNGQKRGILTFA